MTFAVDWAYTIQLYICPGTKPWQNVLECGSMVAPYTVFSLTNADRHCRWTRLNVGRTVQFSTVQFSSVQFSSVQDYIYALGKAHMRSTQSLRSFPNVALETVPMLV